MPPRKLLAARNVGVNIAPPATGEAIARTNPLFGLSKDFPRLVEIELERIDTNPDQPRTVFDEEALRALADSIMAHGLQQPILVQERPGSDRFVLVAGERRLRAHRMLGRPTIFAIITTGRPEEIALIENVQRVDLDLFDQARGLSQLIERHGYTQAEAGAVVGCSANEVNRRLKVLDLPERIRREFRADPDAVSRSALYEIVVAEGEAEQIRLWELAKGGGTVQQMRAARPRKEGGAPEPLRVLGRSLLRMDKELEAIGAVGDALQKEHRDRLRALRDRIDALLGE